MKYVNYIVLGILVLSIFSTYVNAESEQNSIYIATDNVLYKLNASTGEILQKIIFQKTIKIADIISERTVYTNISVGAGNVSQVIGAPNGVLDCTGIDIVTCTISPQGTDFRNNTLQLAINDKLTNVSAGANIMIAWLDGVAQINSSGGVTMNEVNASAQITVPQVTGLQAQQDAQNASIAAFQNGTVSNGTYVGDGTDNRSIAHGLGVVPKLIEITMLDIGTLPILQIDDNYLKVSSGAICNVLPKNSTHFHVSDWDCGNFLDEGYSWVAIGGSLNGTTGANVTSVSGQGVISSTGGQNPVISLGSSIASKFMAWDATYKDLVAAYITDFNSVVFSLVNSTFNQKANKTDIGEFTGGTIGSERYGTGIVVANISDYWSNLTGQGYVTNITVNRSLTLATDTLPSARLDNNQRRKNIPFIISGGDSAITTGYKGHFRVGFNGTLQFVTLVSNETANMTVNIWKDTYANYPPTSADSITGGTPVTLSNTNKVQNTTLAGWTTTVSRNDWFTIVVNSTDTSKLATLDLDYLED